MRISMSATIVLAAAVVIGCSAGPSASPTASTLIAVRAPSIGLQSPTTVPWSAATAAPSPIPTPTSWPTGPACLPSQLVASTWLDGEPPALRNYSVWNDGVAPCSIGRDVAVSVLDGGGHALPVSTRVEVPGRACGGTGGQCPPPGPTAPPWIFMPPSDPDAANGGAGASLTWTNWCGPQPALPLILVVVLGGTSVRTPGVALKPPACTDASKGSELDVAPIEIGGDWPPEPTSIPADGLRATLEVTGPATPGQPFDYVLILTNPTASAIALSPCPTYQERINARGGPAVEEHILNCVGLDPIPPGASVRFAMVIQVPASLPASADAALVWALDPNYSQGFPPVGPAVKVPVSIALQ